PLPAPDPTANTTVAAAAPATSPAAGTPDGLRPQRRPRSAFARFGPSSKARRFVPAARSVPCAVPPSRPPDSAACPLAATSAPRLLRTYPLITSLKVMQSSPYRERMKVRVLIQRAILRAIHDSAFASSNSLARIRVRRSARLVTRLARSVAGEAAPLARVRVRSHRERARVRDICVARLPDAPHMLNHGKFGPSPAAQSLASASPDNGRGKAPRINPSPRSSDR